MENLDFDILMMKRAIELSEIALKNGDVPVGALITKDNKIIAESYNSRELEQNPITHAEMNVIQKASLVIGHWRLEDCTLYVTKEPCVMCSGALILSRIKKVVFGAWDKRYGCCGSLYNLPGNGEFNHKVDIKGGVLENESSKILKDFFKKRRKNR